MSSMKHSSGQTKTSLASEEKILSTLNILMSSSKYPFHRYSWNKVKKLQREDYMYTSQRFCSSFVASQSVV